MADSVYQDIIDAVDTKLKTILTTAAYATNLGSNVNWWRDLENKPFQASELPAVNCKDEIADVSPSAKKIDGYQLFIELNIICSTIVTMRLAISDIVKALNADITWGGLAYNTEIKSSEAEVEQKENKYFSGIIPVEIYFNTVAGDPYTSA